MRPPPTISDLHSAQLSDDGASISLYVLLSDGSTAAVSVPLDTLLERVYVIEHVADPALAILH